MDYNARYYSARLGRFISPDSIVPEPGNSQGYNRYAYVMNNPLKYTDPTGYIQCEGADDCTEPPAAPSPGEDPAWDRATSYDADLSYAAFADGQAQYNNYLANPEAYANDVVAQWNSEAASYRIGGADIYAEYGLSECLSCIVEGRLEGGLAESIYNQGAPFDLLGAGGGELGAAGGGGLAAGIIKWKKGGKNFKLADGASMTTDQALDTGANYLGSGYQDMGNGRFLSADGTRQVRMGDSDITGKHGGGPHMNFEELGPNPAKPGKMKIENNIHIYLTDP